MFNKTFIVAITIMFALFMVLLPIQEVEAGCSDAAAKAAISSLLALGGLTLLDCLTTGCTMTLLWLSIAQGIPFASLFACLHDLLWSNPKP